VIAETMANFEEREARPLFLVTGMINTKDPVGYFEPFGGLAERVFTVPIRGSDAGLDPVALAEDAARAGLEAEAYSTVAEALAEIGRITAEDAVPPRILIGGSLYLVGDVLADNGTPPT
jgi:dihydrofolate synthase/folylpolyglutamate synthase